MSGALAFLLEFVRAVGLLIAGALIIVAAFLVLASPVIAAYVAYRVVKRRRERAYGGPPQAWGAEPQVPREVVERFCDARVDPESVRRARPPTPEEEEVIYNEFIPYFYDWDFKALYREVFEMEPPEKLYYERLDAAPACHPIN